MDSTLAVTATDAVERYRDRHSPLEVVSCRRRLPFDSVAYLPPEKVADTRYFSKVL